MSVKIDGISAGKMYIELLAGKCPKTVAQFLTFVKQQNVDDPNYLGSCFTRLVENGWIQGGEIEQPEDAGPVTAPVLPDENFVVPHDRRGTISLVNKGPNSGVSSFMFMLASSMPYFNRKYVAFGRVIEGDDVLRSMERVDTRFERPCVEVKISDVGIWEKSFAA
jgi:peptidyl-prolyl cis-trans isomerase-like 6